MSSLRWKRVGKWCFEEILKRMFIVTQNVQQNNLPLSQQWWWIIIALIVTAILGPITVHNLKNRFNNKKRIAIIGSNISNINNRNGMNESTTSGQRLYSNFVLNILTVENKRSTTQSVTSIELYKIKKENIDFSDIQYDGGFYDSNQKFVLLAYNNGTKGELLQKRTVKFTFCEKETYNEIKEVEKHTENIDVLKSGDIKSLLIYSFDEFVGEFEKNRNLDTLKISVFDENGNKISHLKLNVFYDRNQKRFYNRYSGRGAFNSGDIPLFDLREDINQQSVSCTQSLKQGPNYIKFYVLVDRSCNLTYRLAIKCGNKKIKSKEKYSLDIRIPVYIQERGEFYGIFYLLLQKYAPTLMKDIDYDKDLIESLDENLIYDKYYAASLATNANIE